MPGRRTARRSARRSARRVSRKVSRRSAKKSGRVTRGSARRVSRRSRRNTMRHRNTNRKVRRNSRRNFRWMRGGMLRDPSLDGPEITLEVTPCVKMMDKLGPNNRWLLEEGLTLYPLPHICLLDHSSKPAVTKEIYEGEIIFGFNSLEDGTVTKLHAHLHRALPGSRKTDSIDRDEGGNEAYSRLNKGNYQDKLYHDPSKHNPLGYLLTNGDTPDCKPPTPPESCKYASRGFMNNPRRFFFGKGGAPGGLWTKQVPSVIEHLNGTIGESSAIDKLPTDFPRVDGIKGIRGWHKEQMTKEQIDKYMISSNPPVPKDPNNLEPGEISIYGGVLITCKGINVNGDKTFEMEGETDFFIPGDGIFSYESEDGKVKCPDPVVEKIPVTILDQEETLVRVTMPHCDGSQKHPYVKKNKVGEDTFNEKDYYGHMQHMSVFFTTSVNKYTWRGGYFKAAGRTA